MPTPFEDLAAYRARENMPVAGSAEDRHTAARLDIDGQTFYGRNAHGMPIDIKPLNAQTPDHAEAHVFQQAKNAGARSDFATIYVDRDFCRSCGRSGGVGSLMRGTGVKELEAHTPDGRFRITAERPSSPQRLPDRPAERPAAKPEREAAPVAPARPERDPGEAERIRERNVARMQRAERLSARGRGEERDRAR
jgi:hypothetical protein